MADRLNPAEQTAAESDYQKKFSHRAATGKDAKDLQQQEAAGDSSWKTVTKKKPTDDTTSKKRKFRFAGRRAGKLHHASAFLFIFAMLGLGVWYTSVFAPNILLVNIKEMYTNDLADATIALDTYYKKIMNYKLGQSNCSEKVSIKCKLSTMSRAQKESFEKHGFTVIGSKVTEDNRDDGQPGNELPEQRYQVTAIIPPAQSPGVIATGDMLFAYAALSDANKALVYGVFNPKSSFFMDARYKERIKTKYNMTKSVTVAGATEQAVNRSFDNSVKNGGGIDTYGRPDPTNGISLGALSSPTTLAQLQVAARATANAANSYVDLQCSWYSLGKSVMNDAKQAKAATIARFAMQYLKAADSIKAGLAEEIPTNVLSGKLAQSTFGGYGANATDSSMYKSIVHGDLPVPSPYGLLYYLDTFDLIGAMIPAWSQIMTTAAAVGAATGATGTLSMPPANLTNTDRQYCLSGETTQNKSAVKEEECVGAITGSAPPGWQGALAGILQTGRETCPHPHYSVEDQRFQGEWLTSPSLKETDGAFTAYVAGLFGTNVMVWANAMSLLFTSSTKGIAASDAIFAGTGEILGDMAMSRGMMPSNAVFMTEYLAQRDKVNKDLDDVARYNGKQNPFDAYNKFSFLGSIVHGLSPTYDEKAPLLATLSNAVSLLGSSVKRLDPSADAIYYLQPNPFNPLRLSCPDPEYLAIGIMADTACNVRYSFSRLELAAQPDSVLDYMTKTHSDAYQSKLEELNERLAQADDEGNREYVQAQINEVNTAIGAPFIDKTTGKATPYSEYEKYLEYCVNRQDPWGRSGIALRRERLPDAVMQQRLNERFPDGEAPTPNNSGDPYERITTGAYASVAWGASSDQDWYSGKKCTEQSEMLTNFRAYTMLCSVDGSLSGAVDCTLPDNSGGAAYSDDFYKMNDILYTSYY